MLFYSDEMGCSADIMELGGQYGWISKMAGWRSTYEYFH
jgi:hypothetical protein